MGKPLMDGFQEESFRSLEAMGLEAARVHCFMERRDVRACMG